MYYKFEENNLQSAETVCSPDYVLFSEDHLTYTYPIDGWYWFDSEEEAKKFFKI